MRESHLSGLDILVLEDEPLLRKQTVAELEQLGANVTAAATLGVARKLLAETTYDFALLDVNLPDGLGTDLLREKVLPSSTGAVVVTAEGGVEGAVEAMRWGALDYIVKPFDPAELPLVLARARRARQTARIDEHRRATEAGNRIDFFFGEALKPMQGALEKILAADRRLQTNLPPVLIQGETGTGKTTIARWIHHNGPRAAGPLIEVNCSALPETLAESELFGHERGAFTDARAARMGLFEAASGGTLFLDELPSLSLPLQAKVLTAIEDRSIRRLGGNKSVPVDARLIGAANRDLKTLVAEGGFREDLYHRLDLFRLAIVPLRERREDLAKLAEMLLAHHCKRHRLPPRRLSDEAIGRLDRYTWPGNVRELSHELERALIFEEEEALRLTGLRGAGTAGASPATGGDPGLDASEWFNPAFRFPEKGFQLEQAINQLMHHALAQSDQNVSAAARLLGVSRDYVRYRLAHPKGNETAANADADEAAGR